MQPWTQFAVVALVSAVLSSALTVAVMRAPSWGVSLAPSRGELVGRVETGIEAAENGTDGKDGVELEAAVAAVEDARQAMVELSEHYPDDPQLLELRARLANATEALAMKRVGYGPLHQCAVDGTGRVACWGLNLFGQLGDGTTSSRATTAVVVDGTHWFSVDVGRGHSCALHDDGQLSCWGWNRGGQLGDGTRQRRTQPVAVVGTQTWRAFAVGGSHTCAIDDRQTLWCWGHYLQGQLGVDSPDTLVDRPLALPGRWQAVGAGLDHTCGVRTDGTLWCWGWNKFGQLGDGSTTDRRTPVRVGERSDWRSVAGGLTHSCATRAGGELWCWGGAGGIQLGGIRASPEQIAVHVVPGSQWRQVSIGMAHTCAIDTQDQLWCWGFNNHGQLGGSPLDVEYLPSRVAGGAQRWQHVTAARNSTCAAGTDGSLWCWGDNGTGQLGDGTFERRREPTRVW